MAWDGMGCHGLAWDGMGGHGRAWEGMGWHGMAWAGMGWHGMAWLGMALVRLVRLIGNWNWIQELEIEIRNQNWKLNWKLDIGEIWNW